MTLTSRYTPVLCRARHWSLLILLHADACCSGFCGLPCCLDVQETFYLVSMASLDASTGSEHLDTEDMHYLREKVREGRHRHCAGQSRRKATTHLLLLDSVG